MSEKLPKYRKHADECRKLARTALTPEDRQQLLVMAETWGQLAETRERALKQTGQK